MAAKNLAAKKATKPAAKTAAIKPITEVMSKTALVAYLSSKTEVAKKDVVALLGALENAILGSIAKKGAGSFVLPGLLKVQSIAVPAKPKRKGVNPLTGEEMVFAAKPATTKVKVRPLKKLKDAAL